MRLGASFITVTVAAFYVILVSPSVASTVAPSSSRETANAVTFIYDAMDGRLRFDPPISLQILEIESASCHLDPEKTTLFDHSIGLFDIRSSCRIFKLDPGGFEVSDLGDILPARLSMGQLAADLRSSGQLPGARTFGSPTFSPDGEVVLGGPHLFDGVYQSGIFSWRDGQVIPGTESILPGPGVLLNHRPLHQAVLGTYDLSGSTFANSDLRDAKLDSATLTDVNFSNAFIAGADFSSTTSRGFSRQQLYSTASYEEKNLQQIRLDGNDLSNWDLARQNLAYASMSHSNLTDVKLMAADLRHANLQYSTMSGADLRGAIITEANFGDTSLTAEQIYSTTSYQTRNLRGIVLSDNDLHGWDLRNQNLTGALLFHAQMANADLEQANLTNAKMSLANLTSAKLNGANLSGAEMHEVDLRNSDLSAAILTNTELGGSRLAGANLTSARITGARFGSFAGPGISRTQLYSTASYRDRALQGIGLERLNLTDWNLSGQNLTNADLRSAILRGVDFTDAIVAHVDFTETTSRGFTKEQLYSTASYRDKNLRGIRMFDNDLAGWDLSGQDLTRSNLSQAYLAGADFSDAIVNNVGLAGATSRGFTKDQLYATGSYQTGTLQGINLAGNVLSGWNFQGQNLSYARFAFSGLRGADLTDTTIRGADFSHAQLHEEQLYSTMSYRDGDLRRVRLAHVDLSGWDLSSQDLTDANLSSATLENANLSGATLANVTFESSPMIETALFDSATVYNQWTRFPDGFAPVQAGLTFVQTARGDFDANGVLDEDDVDTLSNQIRRINQRYWLRDMFDLDSNRSLDNEDLRIWINQLKHTSFGDANLDGKFDSRDLVHVFQAGQYEDSVEDNSTWSTGDWNADGDFNASDFVVALQDGGYEQNSEREENAIPEPSGLLSIILSMTAILLPCERSSRRRSPVQTMS